jgi:Na+/H+ antiporter NhaD/arsenite permease-like protein
MSDVRPDEVTAVSGPRSVVMLSSRWFVLGCAAIAVLLLVLGRFVVLPVWLLAAEVFATILGLFLFGSFRYQIHKNAMTYGMAMVIAATFCGLRTSEWHHAIAQHGWWAWARENLLSFHGLDGLVHADTMLFILGLTFFVAVIAQTRLLEGITFSLLRRNNGSVLPTIIAVTGVVAFASGILDGVSMIGLTIRTLVIIMLLAAAPTPAIRYAVMVCTMVTTICGIWLAYGEPPNLIMKANLFPHVDNQFFLRYCAPAAVAAFMVIAWQLRTRLGTCKRIDMGALDIVDANAADVRFLQATHHGEVLSPIELVEEHEAELGARAEPVLRRLHDGESLGLALVREGVPERLCEKLLGIYVSESLAESLERHYTYAAAGDEAAARKAEKSARDVLAALGKLRRRAQIVGALALVPFIGALIWHSIDHDVPLFVASFAGFLAALPGIARIANVRNLALREARHEFAEYYFLFPLFLSITLLTKAGFFDAIQALIDHGIHTLGPSHVAVLQFLGATFLSAILDNNVVADFASRALHHLDIAVLHLFAMAQIAGYAVGGCWTHIGSAQSVVAFAFIRRDVDEHYTPVQWIKEMTPVILQVLALLMVLIYIEGALLRWLG